MRLGTIDTSVRHKYSTITGTGIVQPLTRAKEKLTLTKLDETTPKELKEGSNLKWGYPEKRNGVDKNTEQWVSDQNKFWEKK